MKGESLELFRLAILGVMNANRTRFGLNSRAIGLNLGVFGFPGSKEEDRADAIDYLVRKGFAEEVAPEMSAENRAWRITSQGIAFMDAHGAA